MKKMIFLENSTSDYILGIISFLLIVGIIFFIFIFTKSLVVVPFNEIHIISKKKKVFTYDGRGRYLYFSFLHGRTIIPKHVLDIEPALIKLHDKDNLPFGVEISIKIQVVDPEKAAATLTTIKLSTVSKLVEDTVMSAARSIAMERTIIEIMKNREDIEQSIYNMVNDALMKLGLSPIIFDIKNIRDFKGTEVIANLEKVKISELEKEARISRSINENKALAVELEKRKESNVKKEQMIKEEEDARLNREKLVAIEMKKLEEEKLKIEEMKKQKLAEIERTNIKIKAEAEREKKLLEAQAEAEAIKIKAEAEKNAIMMKAEAEAERIRKKGLAEAEILKKKTEVLSKSSLATQVKILEILADAQIKSSAEIANALGSNAKIMYLPNDNKNGNGILNGLLPKIDSLFQSGVLENILKLLKNAKNNNDDSDSKDEEELIAHINIPAK
ncbi:MAG: SPFH domain-containing protein [Promethearchaeota archaeon]